MSATYAQGRYRVHALLGGGAFSEVHEVDDQRLGVRRALKVLRPEVVGDASVRVRFEAEARTMAMLSHPHLVSVMDVGEDVVDGAIRPWLVMELLGGGTVEDAIAWGGAMDPAEAVRAMLGVIDGVSLAHRAGIVHRDIKPANILRAADGTLKLGDFGIAQLRSLDDVTRTGVALGSWAFMAPEQRLDPRSVGPASDVYGLAATLVWMIRGGAVSDLHVAEHRARLLVGVPDRIAGALARALAFRPEERYHKAEAFGEVLALALDAPSDTLDVSRGSASGGAGGPPRLVAAPSGSPLPPVLLPPDRWASARGWATFAFAAITALAAVVAATAVVLRPPAVSPAAVASPAAVPWCEVSARSFAGPTAPGPRETVAAAAADLDGDGVVDAIYTNQLDESVTVWWGPFERSDRQDIPVGRSAFPPIVHDVDGDGALDLIVSLSDDAAFAVVRGLGARRFGPPQRVMQGPGPRASLLVATPEGSAALFLAGGQLLARRVTGDGRWPQHRTLLDVPLLTQAAFAVDGDDRWVALFGTTPSLVRLDRTLTVREQRAVGWPALKGAFAADLVPPAGDELYGRLADGQVVRLPRTDAEQPCAVTSADAMPFPGVMAQLDGDGVPDIVMADTCAECTSSQMVRFGQASERVVGTGGP